MTKCTSTTFQNERLQWIVLDTVYSLLKIKMYTTHCAKRYQMLVSFSWPFSGNEPSKIERKDHLWLCRIMPKSWRNLFTYSLFQKTSDSSWNFPVYLQHEFFILINSYWFSSVQFIRSVVSNSLRPHELQHTRPPCPSPTPGVLALNWVKTDFRSYFELCTYKCTNLEVDKQERYSKTWPSYISKLNI